MTIKQILKMKGPGVTSVPPSATILDVAKLLREKRIGAVLVQDAPGKVIGILSERDIVRFIAEHGARTLEMTAAQLMTSEVRTASCDDTVQEVMALMTQRRFRHLPVLENGELCGLISIGDVVKTMIDEKEHEVESLRAYVAGAA